MKCVLDSSAIIAYLRDEPGSDYVEAILTDPESELILHAVNLLEVYYKMAMFGGEIAVKDAIDDLLEFNFDVYSSIEPDLLLRSGFFKTRYPFLSLADSICIALSVQMRATVVTSDRPSSIVKDGAVIELIR